MEISHGSVKFGTSFVEGIKHTLGQAYDTVKENIPIVGQVEEFYAGSADREQARLEERGFTPEQIDTANAEKQQYTKTGEATTQFLDTVSDVTNVDRDLVGAGAFALETLLDARAGGQMAIKTARGAVQLMDAEPVYALTATRNLAPGVKPGIAKQPDYQLGVGKLRAQGAADDARRAKFMDQFASGEIDRDTLTERLSKVKKRGDAKYSTLATEKDPDIFEKRKFQNPDPTNPGVMADQHHATTKAMTTPWVKKALEIGDDDDVVALFELHRALTGSGMGNAKSGIIDAPGVVHDTAKARKAGREPKQAIHSLFKEKGAGIEIRTDKVEKIIGNPKNMDELLDNYVTFANEYLIPQKEISLKVVKKELARHRATLSGDALKDFDLMVEKLNKANTK